jgi:topoisomerase IA-like protein
MNPFEYRKRILAEHEEANDRAVQELIDEVTQGAQITMKGTIYGPYVNHSTYYLSTGKSVEIVEPASLHWVGLDIIGGHDEV